LVHSLSWFGRGASPHSPALVFARLDGDTDFQLCRERPRPNDRGSFSRYSNGEVLADSASLQWPGLFVRRSRFPRAVDRFLVPSTPEPLMSCVLAGSAEFRERDVGQTWVRRQLKRGDIFITRSKVPYELGWRSPAGEELDYIIIHLAVDQFLAALEAVYPGRAWRGGRD
jgi:AraC family transcriptional regulator